jgi:hypothetical protein
MCFTLSQCAEVLDKKRNINGKTRTVLYTYTMLRGYVMFSNQEFMEL